MGLLGVRLRRKPWVGIRWISVRSPIVYSALCGSTQRLGWAELGGRFDIV